MTVKIPTEQEWLDAQARGEVRPVTVDDLVQAYNARKRKRKGIKQVSPWVFVVNGKIEDVDP